MCDTGGQLRQAAREVRTPWPQVLDGVRERAREPRRPLQEQRADGREHLAQEQVEPRLGGQRPAAVVQQDQVVDGRQQLVAPRRRLGQGRQDLGHGLQHGVGVEGREALPRRANRWFSSPGGRRATPPRPPTSALSTAHPESGVSGSGVRGRGEARGRTGDCPP